jgi:hypothetical protein
MPDVGSDTVFVFFKTVTEKVNTMHEINKGM